MGKAVGSLRVSTAAKIELLEQIVIQRKAIENVSASRNIEEKKATLRRVMSEEGQTNLDGDDGSGAYLTERKTNALADAKTLLAHLTHHQMAQLLSLSTINAADLKLLKVIISPKALAAIVKESKSDVFTVEGPRSNADKEAKAAAVMEEQTKVVLEVNGRIKAYYEGMNKPVPKGVLLEG